MQLEVNKIYNGFKLFEEKRVKEINSLARLFVHEKSGARLLELENEDDNKVFSVSFRTPPTDSSGLPHILEHSVLCGSRKYPLKDPFVQLAKGSLNTFLNAMTFSDKTMYPVASTNDKDFRNLMDVYLDAVFHPNIYKRPEILMQEGWHYDIEDKNQEITYKGVVYNEMKGAFSSPEAVLYHKIQESLFPETPYGLESGGDPEVIPELTQEDFLNFHKKYYHPSNSFLFLYGNIDILEQLKFINDNYLQEFDAIDVDSKIPLQKPFSNTKEVTTDYPISQNEEEKDKTFLSLNFVVGKSTDAEQYLAFEILEYMLLETPAAPLKKALLEAELGQDVFGIFDNSILQPVLSVVVKNTDVDKKDKFKQVVLDTLKQLVSSGIDKSLIEAAINRKEFDLREADYHGFSKGLLYTIKCMDSWLYGARPTMHLEYESALQKVKAALKTNYFEKLIEEYLLNNSHSSLLILQPKCGLAEKMAVKTKKELTDFKANLSETELDSLVKQALELKKNQNTEDAPEDLEKIPMLSLSDINPKAKDIQLLENEFQGTKVLLHPDFTNQIAYLNLMFDLSIVPQEVLPYVGLLVNILGKVNTDVYNYMDLSNQININTGGITYNAEIFLQSGSDQEYYPKLVIKSKALVDKVPKLMELINEVILNSKFSEKSRLKEIIFETKSRMEMAISEQGHTIAKNRLLSYFSPRIKYLEQVNGLSFYKFIAAASKDFENKYPEITAKLEQIIKIIFNKHNLLISLTCEEKHYQQIEKSFHLLINNLSQEQLNKINYQFELSRQNEGLLTPAKVQYVAKAYNFLKLGHQYSGTMQVLKTILSLDYLWNRVRVQGGAYGSFVGFERNGDMFFCSYRDPNLRKTLDIYDQVDNYLKGFQISEREMTKYIIGTISKLDFPLTPSLKGDQAAAYFISGINQEDLQNEREEVLSVKPKNVQAFADLFRDAMSQNYICVMGNEAQIKENKDIFKNLVSVFE